MTFTSFNSIQSQPQTMQVNQPLSLREGQVFHGTINKLYPDQTAEVQVGQHKLIAKLETPLKAGDAHFFQVTSTAAQTELKVVTGPMTQAMTPQQQMNQLLQNMNLPQTKELQQVLGHFMKEQVPISRDQLLAAESWMKALPEGVTKQDALGAMQRMVELKMPFTNQVFQALIHGAKTDGMSHALQNFMNQLATATSVNDQVKTNLMTQLQTLTKPLDAETGGVLLARAVQQLTDNTASVANRIQALAVLKEAGIVPLNATLANWQSQQGQAQTTVPLSTQPTHAGQLMQQVTTAKPEESAQMLQNVRTFIQNESLLTNEQKAQLNQLIDRFTQLSQNKQTTEVFTRQLNEQLLKAFSASNDNRLFAQNTFIQNESLLTNEQKAQLNQLKVMTAKPQESAQMLQNVRTFIQNESLLTNEQKVQLNQLIDRFTQLPQNKQTMEVFARQLNEQLLKAFSASNDNRLFTQNTFIQNESLLTNEQKAQLNQLKVMTAKPQESAQMVQNVRTFIQNESLLTNEQKVQLNQLIDRFTQLSQNKQTMEVFARQLNEQLLKAFSASNDSRLFTQNEASLSTKDQILSLLRSDTTLANNDVMLRALVRASAESVQPSVQTSFTQAEAQVQNAVDSKAMEQALKKVLKGLGISYEAALSNKAGDIQALTQQLKPQLLSLLQEPQIPSALRDSAEMLMARMNGMQLLSGENGHQHQLIMQVPLDFFGKKMDATLQWNGRMGKDGKIDANFARVLFYLNMESLQETVIDMQVQNRIVTITVFNDNPQLDLLAEPLKQSLKSGLFDKKYHLSGFFIKKFAQPTVDNVTKKSQNEIENTVLLDIRV